MEIKPQEKMVAKKDNGVSIGPRLFRHGNIWISRSTIMQAVGVSIGPRLFRHGNIKGLEIIQPVIMVFQLGHVFSDMEIT